MEVVMTVYVIWIIGGRAREPVVPIEYGRAREPVVPIESEETEKSWFQKLREKIGFNQGGIADINYLTRRL